MRLGETQRIIKYGGWCNLIKVKVVGNRNSLETLNLFWFWVPKKLKLNWLAKRVGMMLSLSVMKGYNRHINGFPKMTLSVIFLTRTKVVLKLTLSWQTLACGILNSICISPPLAEVNLSLVFWKYLGGTIPS